MNADMKVNLGGLEMASPVVAASGTFGYGTEYLGAADYSKIGAVTAKGVRLEPWLGNAMPRHCEVPGGLVNAIGLQGAGVESFLSTSVPWYASNSQVPMIVNIWGGTPEEYAEVARRVSEAAASGPCSVIKAIECNVSCPNVREGGHAFGHDTHVLARLVRTVREATALPLIVKLPPNVASVVPYVKACEDGGADAISLINTIPAMVIDIERRRPALGNVSGGLSGRCVHPVAVKAVYDAHRATKLPILAMGGVYTAADAIELMLAGGTAVAVGTAAFSDPGVFAAVHDGIAEYCERHGFSGPAALTGALEA